MAANDSTRRLLDAWYLTGPTAAGKSVVSLHLAERLGAEIVSLDSMAIYRGMEIGVAKPDAAARAQVPHHLLDLRDPNEDYSLSNYLADAWEAHLAIQRRGRQTLFVGGTPLYLKALLRGLFSGPPADAAFRDEMQSRVAAEGSPALHAELAALDPPAAAKLHPNDARRIIRALEVHRLTGRPISELQQQFERPNALEETRVFALDWPRDQLHARIERRVDAMLDAGLVAEVRGLRARYGRLSRTASQAVGYREALDHLGGVLDERELRQRIQAHTRQLAKRQETWFRALEEVRGVAALGRAADEIADEILRDRL